MAKGVKEEGFISKAVLKNYRVSPRKARLVADLVRGRQVEQALDVLSGCDKKTAPALSKLILSAVANAKDLAKIDIDELYIQKIWVNEARKYKRFMPRAHGRATPIIKRHSHITVVLDELGARK